MIHRAKPLCTAYCTWENECPLLPLPAGMDWTWEPEARSNRQQSITAISLYWHRCQHSNGVTNLEAVPLHDSHCCPVLLYHWKGTNKTAVRWLLIWCHLVCFWLVWLTPFRCPVHSTVQIRREAKLRSPRKQFMLLFSFQQGNALYSRHSTVETALIFSFLNVIWRHWLRLRFIASLCISLQVHFVTQIRHKRLSDVHFKVHWTRLENWKWHSETFLDIYSSWGGGLRN